MLGIDLLEVKVAKEKELGRELTKDKEVELFENELKKLREGKHEVPGISYKELREIPEFFEQLKNVFEKISIVKGNHDANLERLLLKEVRLYSFRGFKIKNLASSMAMSGQPRSL